MKTSTPRTSRLAAVANARRRQRKERLSVGSPLAAASPHAAKSPAARQPLVARSPARRNARAQNKQPAIEQVASSASTLDTSSNVDNNENINQSNTLHTLPTDDESMSTWSQAASSVSGFTDDSFIENTKPMPTSITSRKPKNITVITEESNILSPCADSGNISHRVFSPRTPKMTNSNISDNTRSMMKLIDELTQERDRLRLDGNLFKRKLAEAHESNAQLLKEKDQEITQLMKSIGNLTVLIDEVDENKNELTVQISASGKTMREMEEELSSTVCELNKVRDSYVRLKKANAARAKGAGKELEGDFIQTVRERDELDEKYRECVIELQRAKKAERVYQETIAKQTASIEQLKKELAGKEELESNFDECVEELNRIQGTEEKYQITIQHQAAQIDALKKQLEASISKFTADETALQKRIFELESKTKSLSNEHKEDKRNYESMIKTLKEQLNTDKEAHKEEKASLVKGMEEMKDGFTQSSDAYKKKIEALEMSLEVATQQLESTKKELSQCDKERNEVVAKLEQLNADFGCAKTARGKDINMLESELEKALASKMDTEKQLKDTRRQLQNALHSLDEMAYDGGKMRTDLEDVTKNFNKEKDALHRELAELKHQAEVQKSEIDNLNLDKKRSDETCDELRRKIRELEGAKNQYGNSDDIEMMQLEIKYLKNKLNQASSANCLTSSNGYHRTISNSALEQQMEQLRASEKSKAFELSQARQTIQKLKTKEKYLESRVESLANQITKTVQEYENRLGEARELGQI